MKLMPLKRRSQLGVWCTLVISVFGRLRLEDLKLEASLGYVVRLCLQKRKKTTQNK
jgi:hypothetical protein